MSASVSWRQLDNAAVSEVVCEQVKSAFRPLTNLADSVSESNEYPLLCDDVVADEDQTRHMLSRECADKDVALPLRNQISRVKSKVRWCNRWRPEVDGLLQAALCRDTFAYRGSIIVAAVRDNRP